MSRKAKEKGKANPTTPQSKPVIKFNQNWFIGRLGISAIIAIGYFLYKSREAVNEAPPELQPYHRVPQPEASRKMTKDGNKKQEPAKAPDNTFAPQANAFDLNSF